MNKNYEKAIAALVSTSTIAEAAKQCGLSEPTLYRYLQDEAFTAEYRKARRSVYESALGQIQSVTAEAVMTLKDALASENDSVKVRAAQIILDYSGKAFEQTEVLERLEALEAAQSALK